MAFGFLRPLFRWYFTRSLRQLTRNAVAVSYVSEALETRYPAAPEAFTTRYSSVDLPDEAFVAQPRGDAEPPA